MDDEEELLNPAGPRIPRRIRLGALVLAGLAVVAVVVVRAWPRSGPAHRAAPPTTTPPTAPPTGITPPWPSAPGACNSATDIPIVSSTPTAEITGIHLLLGSDRLHIVDFDTGRHTDVPGAAMPPGEFVGGLVDASGVYATTSTCTGSGAHVVRLGTNRRVSVVRPSRPISGALSGGGDRAWGVVFPDAPHSRGYLVPLDGGSTVRLPADFSPTVGVDRVIVGNGVVGESSNRPGRLILVDARTGGVLANLQPGLSIAAGHGVLLWSSDCTFGSGAPCVAQLRTLATGSTTNYVLPRPPGFAYGVVSSDGRQVAFTLERREQDPRFAPTHPEPPNDIAILHLDTGRVDVVPGVELPTKMAPGLAFSPDGRWLVIALDAGSKTRLLAWRPGLALPYEAAPVPGESITGPSVLALP